MGDSIDYQGGRWIVPEQPVIPFIEGDGTGPDIWRAARRVFDATVQRTSGGKRRVDWREVLAGEKAFKATGSWLPDNMLELLALGDDGLQTARDVLGSTEQRAKTQADAPASSLPRARGPKTRHGRTGERVVEWA